MNIWNRLCLAHIVLGLVAPTIASTAMAQEDGPPVDAGTPTEGDGTTPTDPPTGTDPGQMPTEPTGTDPGQMPTEPMGTDPDMPQTGPVDPTGMNPEMPQTGPDGTGTGGTGATGTTNPPPTSTKLHINEPNNGGPPDICTAKTDMCQPYVPQYPLWSDGSYKPRFVYLPTVNGVKQQIDTSDADHWKFPKGTRFYKNFMDIDRTTLLETRVISKVADGQGAATWVFQSYRWDASDNKKDPVLIIQAPLDKPFLNETSTTETVFDKTSVLDNSPQGKIKHTVPTLYECSRCHDSQGKDSVLGFGAIQLNGTHSLVDDEVMPYTLQNLIDGGWTDKKNNASEWGATIGGDETARKAIGYLHGNCGSCHGDGSSAGASTDLVLRALVNKQVVSWDSPEAEKDPKKSIKQPVIRTGICRNKKYGKFPASMNITMITPPPMSLATPHTGLKPKALIQVGDPDGSYVFDRMRDRAPADADGSLSFSPNQMPPIATHFTDVDGVSYVEEWIKSLATSSPCPSTPLPTSSAQ